MIETLLLARFKPRDKVLTPTGRVAVVLHVRLDGKRDLRYLDDDGGEVALEPKLLTLVSASKVQPWPSRNPP